MSLIGKHVQGFSRYFVVSDGRVYSEISGKWLKPSVSGRGYLALVMKNDSGVLVRKYIHRLVLETLCSHPQQAQCRHLNGDKQDNRLENLAWGTAQQNYQDKLLHGTATLGERNSQAKLSEENVCSIRKLAADGISTIDIAEKLGISRQNVRLIVRRKRWSHV